MQPPSTTYNLPQPSTTTHNHPHSSTTTKRIKKRITKRINFNFHNKGLFICSSEYSSHCLFLNVYKIKQPVSEVLQNSRPATTSEILYKNIDEKLNVLYISNYILLKLNSFAIFESYFKYRLSR